MQGNHSEVGPKWSSSLVEVALVEVPIQTYLPRRYLGWSSHRRELESHNQESVLQPGSMKEGEPMKMLLGTYNLLLAGSNGDKTPLE